MVCTDLSAKEPYKQIGVDRVMTSGSLGGVMVNTLPLNARYVGSIPALGASVSYFHNPHENMLGRRKYHILSTLLCDHAMVRQDSRK